MYNDTDYIPNSDITSQNNDSYPVTNGFVKLTFIFGLLSIITTFLMTVYPPFIFGGLALVFGILSRTHNQPLLRKTKLGMICAVLGLICNIFIVGTSIHAFLTNPEIKAEVNKIYESTYGMTFDEMMQEILEESELMD